MDYWIVNDREGISSLPLSHFDRVVIPIYAYYEVNNYISSSFDVHHFLAENTDLIRLLIHEHVGGVLLEVKPYELLDLIREGKFLLVKPNESWSTTNEFMVIDGKLKDSNYVYDDFYNNRLFHTEFEKRVSRGEKVKDTVVVGYLPEDKKEDYDDRKRRAELSKKTPPKNDKCPYCPTDDEIKKENEKLKQKIKEDEEKLKSKKIKWKQMDEDFEKSKEEIRKKLWNVKIVDTLTPKSLYNKITNKMLNHYTGKTGRDLTIDELGITNTLRKKIKEKGAFKSVGNQVSESIVIANTNPIATSILGSPLSEETSLHQRFIRQIIKGQVYSDSSYNIIEIAYALGKADIRGIFNGKIEVVKNKCTRSPKCKELLYKINGVVSYHFRDAFQSPIDLLNIGEMLGKKTIDVDGVPYLIKGKIMDEKINNTFDKDGNKIN